MKRIIITLSIIMLGYSANSQVLISLLLGDKLNTGKIEFGLDGGWNLSQIHSIEGAKPSNQFNIGFYFDIKVFKNPKWMIHTGVLVKSTMGCEKIPVYLLNDATLDTAFKDGSVERKINYFNVPIMMKYMVFDKFYVEAGVMAALRNKAVDIFNEKIVDDDDLQYKLNINDRLHRIDCGGIAGLGYRFVKGNGMNLGIRYYYGFVDISYYDGSPNEFNSSLYVSLEIPIGKGKAEKKAAEKKATETQKTE